MFCRTAGTPGDARTLIKTILVIVRFLVRFLGAIKIGEVFAIHGQPPIADAR